MKLLFVGSQCLLVGCTVGATDGGAGVGEWLGGDDGACVGNAVGCSDVGAGVGGEQWPDPQPLEGTCHGLSETKSP